MSVLQLQKVSYAYYKEHPVLTEIDMCFERGKMYVILGPSGCGKTTLLSLLGGLDIPKAGRILYEGEDIGGKKLERHRRDHVSFVFQNYNLIDYMTPLENVMLTARQDPAEALAQLGLTEDESRRSVLKLSGGQQQRVAIARALASETPSYWPTSRRQPRRGHGRGHLRDLPEGGPEI
jgi:putative ABC transport system ATP-binding protein